MTTRLKLATLLFLLSAALQACAGVTLFLEEPYGYDGVFAGTGHAAVYLERVCAQSPILLRRCTPGETGVVLSRYMDVAGHDWIATPLIAYLYAVDRAESVPLSADSKLADFLRNQYRRGHLESIVPDGPLGQPPGGRWVETAGVSYRRTIYAYQIDTTEEQDEGLIRKYNLAANRRRFNFVTHNCADFVRDLINFYYPKALHRGVITDLGVTTPKRIAKCLIRFGERHPELHFSSYVIPQVPGSIRRSRSVRGIVESAFRAKKYMLPLFAFHPVMAGCFVVAALAADRFNPAQNAMIFNPRRKLEPPLEAAQRRLYQTQLDSLERASLAESPEVGKRWQQLQTGAVPQLDDSGDPVLQVKLGDATATVGLSRYNILPSSAPPELAKQVLVARLREELRNSGPPKVSESDVEEDWELLQQLLIARRGAVEPGDARLAAIQF